MVPVESSATRTWVGRRNGRTATSSGVQCLVDFVATAVDHHRTPATPGPMTPPTRLLRLVAWNLDHQANERLIRLCFFEALAAMTPDPLVLNEYVH